MELIAVNYVARQGITGGQLRNSRPPRLHAAIIKDQHLYKYCNPISTSCYLLLLLLLLLHHLLLNYCANLTIRRRLASIPSSTRRGEEPRRLQLGPSYSSSCKDPPIRTFTRYDIHETRLAGSSQSYSCRESSCSGRVSP